MHELVRLVTKRLQDTTTRTVRKYAKKHGENKVHRFKPGDHVGLRRARPGELSDDAEPGFVFIRYIDEHMHSA